MDPPSGTNGSLLHLKLPFNGAQYIRNEKRAKGKYWGMAYCYDWYSRFFPYFYKNSNLLWK